MLILAILFLPLMILLIPLMIFIRLKKKHRVKIALIVSNQWPDYLQYARFPYDLALFRAGAGVETISPRQINQVNKILEKVDGVLFSGGADIGDDEPYDKLSFNVIKEAEKRNMPVLGVCRGMQLIAINHGGTLTTHDDDPDLFMRHKASSFSLAGHNINIKADSKLNQIFRTQKIHVNSLHHQSVENPGDLYVSATSDDGTIEAVESLGHNFIIGVQWHPELRALFNLKNEEIFKTLVQQAGNLKK